MANLEFHHEGWSSFSATGDWRSGGLYRMVVQPGLTDNTGEYVVSERLEIPLEIVPRVKGAGFGYAGKYYFPRRQGTEFFVESRNLKETAITVSRLFPSNIAVAIESLQDGRSGEFSERWAETLATQTLTFQDAPDTLLRTAVDLRDLFADDWRGVFRLSVADSWSGKIVVWTDIGVLAHWQDEEVVVFAHDLTTLEPMAGAKVTVYSEKNQELGVANTDAQGIATLRALNTGLGTPRVVVVETEKDYTFLELERRDDDPVTYSEEMTRFDQDGYDAFIYADRDLYRPGETAHLHWLVRTNYGDAIEGVPLKLTVRRPNGSVYVSEAVTLSALGTGGHDLQTDKMDPTGRYTVQLSTPGGARPIGMYYFSVEEFVPNRIAVETMLDQTLWAPGAQQSVQVQARHLFGAPASDRKCEVEVALLKGALRTERWKDYRFTNSGDFQGQIISAGSAKTDDEGRAAFTVDVEVPGEATFPLRALVRGRVFELGGRAVTATQEATIFPGEVCLGLRCAEAADKQGVEVFVAAIQPDESPAPLESVQVILEREEWSYYVREYHGYNDWQWTKAFQELERREVALSEGRGSTVFPIPRWGYYRVKVVSDTTKQYSDQQFYGHWGGRVELADQARPSLLKLTLNQKEYAVGQEVEARLESPFDGIGYVVVQGEHLSRAQSVRLVDGVGVVRFAVSDAEVPNVWVEATVVHKASEDSAHVYPYASFAMTNVGVRNPRRSLAVAFPDLPEETRPAADWSVALETRDHTGAPVAAEVTVAAVDEGIHALTDYTTPDPYAWLLRSRRPEFNRAHYYDKVAYDFGKTPIGGDAIARRFGKDAPFVGDNWIKPVALWSGVVRTDENGQGRVTFSVPEYSGQLRLVAVACTRDAVGAGSGNIYVRRPYMLRTSMPRFAMPGDRFQCRAVVFNTTDAPCTARVSWRAEGALAGGDGAKEIAVEPSREAAAIGDFAAGMGMGQGTIHWRVEVLDAAGAVVETLTEEAPIPVRPPAMYETTHELAVIGPGESRTFKNSHYIEAVNTTLDISVSADPMLRLRDALKHVVGYPYGCVEQTTSRCLPMYLLRRNKALIGTAFDKDWAVDAYLQAGVDRLFSMQTGDGGLGGWPGASTSYPYGSVYACHFLTLAKRDGELRVPDDAFKALQEYVRGVGNNWDANSDMYRYCSTESALHQRAYAHYVLAIDGDIDAIRGIERFDALVLPTSARYLLAAALALNTQDTDRVRLYLSSAPSEPYQVTEQDGTLNSDIRNTAIKLLALMQMGGDDPACFELVNRLTRYIETQRYGSTQETAFIVTALAMYFQRIEQQ
ncbi:MAG TPA: MG2 domain-containing protein, partial [Candidatus Hydrogenedentes bacterium]|nr:MG2 domain-containing protein [Candidatus Hydrogenedentota bacterium]